MVVEVEAESKGFRCLGAMKIRITLVEATSCADTGGRP